MYPIFSAWVLDATTGLPNKALVGQQVQVVTRNTTTPYPIFNAASDPIPSSLVTVLEPGRSPDVYIDTTTPESVYLEWYDAGTGQRGPIWFEEVSRQSAVASAASSAASAASSATSQAAAATTAAEVAALRGWVDKGVTTRNVILDPRATDAAKWSAVNAPSTELMVTGASDGPTLPDGSKATTYARYTMTADVGSIATSFGYQIPNEDVGAWPSGTRLAASIYIRSSVAIPAAYPALSQQMPGTPWTESAAQRLSSVLTAIPANTWVRLADTFQSTANAGAFGTRAFLPATSSVLLVNGAVVEVTVALAAPGATTVPDHYDGDTPSTSLVGYGWEGTRNASVSRRIDMKLVRSVNGQVPDASGNVLIEAGGGGTTDHRALSHLNDSDDHPQYLNPARGDQRYYPRATVDAIAASATSAASEFARQRGNHTGTQGIGTITGLQEALNNAGGSAGPDIPRIAVAETDDHPRPEGVVVFWFDAREDRSTPPLNMGPLDRWSPGVGTTTVDLIAPSTPTGLTISSITATGATVSWTASTDNVGVTGYEVRLNGTISLGVSPTAPTATSRVITGRPQNTAHTVAVRARDLAGNWSPWSAEAPFTTSASSDTTPPTAPTGLAASSITGSGFTVTWGAGTDNVGVTGYDIRLNGGAPETVDPSPRSKTFTGLAGETTYTVEIRSRDAAGNVTATWASLNVTTLEAAGETYSVYGAGAPTGTWTWGTDGTPYIVIGRGFQCSAAGARAVGGRAWIPTAASGSLPTEATFYLFGPNANIGTTPVQTKVASTAGATAGSWVEAMFDVPQAMTSGQVWMIGVRFTGTGDAGKYSFGTGTRPNSNEVISNGDLGADLAWAAQNGGTAALSSNFKIGTGSVTSPGEQMQSYGVDILVDLEG